MLKRNNPHIDFDTLEADVQRNLARIQAAGSGDPQPATGAGAVDEGFTTPGTGAIENLEDLYQLNGDAFVNAAYREFLGREPDPEGMNAYLSELTAGTSKADILVALRYSEDGSAREQRFNLRGARLKNQLVRMPVVGRVFSTLFALAGIAGLKRSMLAWQHQLHRVSRETHALRLRADQHSLRADQQALDLNDAEHELNVQRVNTVAEIEATIAAMETRIQREITALRAMQSALQNAGDAVSGGAVKEQPDVDFYRRFEEHFRGPASEIAQRLAIYPPLLEERLPAALKSHPMLDLGCGRGEWLELLQHHGYNAHGVDLDSANVSYCSERSLSVEKANALEYLSKTPSESVALISALHVIEHLSFEELNMLLTEAMRVLAPGGLVLLETPNPENLITAAHEFYLDPSHHQPLPPDLVEFLLDYRSFVQVETHRLHPAPKEQRIAEQSATAERLNELISGPRDYAVIAAKPA